MTPPRADRDRAVEPLDARLAVGAGAAWLATFLLVDSATPAAALVTTALTAGVAALLLVATRGRTSGAGMRSAGLLRAAALACCCTALVLLPLAARLAHARAAPLQQLARQHATVVLEASVTADPRVLAAKGPAGAPRVAVETAALEVSVSERQPPAVVDGDVLVLGDADDWRDVLPGQRVRLRGALQPDLDGGVLSVTLFGRDPPRLLGQPPWWQRAAGTVRASLRRAVVVLPDQERGLLPGLVDGDTANLDPVLAEHFRAAGLTHLVAVSGTNCSIVVGAVLLVLRRLRVRPWVCAVLGGLVLLTFVVVARPSPSVLRAAAMASIALVSLAAGRPRAALPALAAVALALLVWDPTLATSASFAMSVLATAGLLVLAPGWARALRARGVPAGLAESVAVAAAAHLVTAPVVAGLSGRISVVAVVANVLAEPVVAVTTVLGFAAAVVAPGWLAAGQLFAWLAGWPCRWLTGVADLFGGLPGATLPWLGGSTGALALLGVLAVLGVLALRAGFRYALAAALVTVAVVLLPVRALTSGWPPTGWVFAACDVGQGDALVLDAGGHAGVLVDAGPDPVPVDRCLHELGVTSLPLVVLTHLHLDHVGGLAGAVRGRPVGQVLTGPLPDPATGLQLALRASEQRHRILRTPAPGTRLRVGAVTIEVLGPRAAYHGTRSDPNNSSLVLRATVAGVRILLPGDAEIEAQRTLERSGVDLRADVLKVPHHGSAYSDPAFLAAAHARVAIVSVGLHNDYGHPSPVLLGELARLGVPLLRTDRDGDVAVVSADGGVSTVVHGIAASERTAAGAVPRPSDRPLTASAAGARMAPCLHARSEPTICPSRCRRYSCSSATRTSSSTAPSARSPPLRSAPMPTRWSPSAPAARSRVPSCTSCWVRRCSATRGC
ncbi:competence protein ComEC [Jatrophihabitans endophyticus]|uniref:Competence protein ComEC n=1 Tax=Jatrophihabitans endophyticus TaxID=1206085 RepID=A0A1M5KBZ1_9ACTN|nr:competence protein ComEC [Jatrophihabitans endophyticus]